MGRRGKGKEGQAIDAHHRDAQNCVHRARRPRAMDAKEAITLAKKYVQDVYKDEPIDKIGLEEIEFDEIHQTWLVTIGFVRLWAEGVTASFIPTSERIYKIINLTDDGTVRSMKNRQTDSAGV